MDLSRDLARADQSVLRTHNRTAASIRLRAAWKAEPTSQRRALAIAE
jgi:hypothetical protein